MDRVTMKNMPKEERPYEKCLKLGPGALSDRELLAIIIRTGSKEATSLELAGRILERAPAGEGLLSLLHRSFEELSAIKGVGPVKAVQLLCVGELSRRIWKAGRSAAARPFTEPEMIADFYMEDMRHLEREEIRVMYLNTKQYLLRDLTLSKGTVNASIATPREILIEGLRCLAAGIVLVHNHPSGDPEPSRSDLLLTRRVREAADLVGIPLVDHVIIGDRRFVSLRQRGAL